jgi:hypothetical protein
VNHDINHILGVSDGAGPLNPLHTSHLDHFLKSILLDALLALSFYTCLSEWLQSAQLPFTIDTKQEFPALLQNY